MFNTTVLLGPALVSPSGTALEELFGLWFPQNSAMTYHICLWNLRQRKNSVFVILSSYRESYYNHDSRKVVKLC